MPLPSLSTTPSAETPYTVRCAWCGEETGHYSPVPHSHGMCDACQQRIMREMDEEDRQRRAATDARTPHRPNPARQS